MEKLQIPKTLDAKIEKMLNGFSKMKLTYCCSLYGMKANTGDEVLT